ncbi:N-acetyl-gamma-glutamyl-phosphate reductase (plasmid) [Pseudalkalibacillus hwajinpoensis]|uniref:N-acetyl-gamma-glutamyl-phosphate reductase n=1 Tax=Guptibacillus hwajinpoensis TaxID=208199 RepID=UPI00325BB667
MSQNIKIAILGGSGFVGMEIYRILRNHPLASIDFVSSESRSGRPVEKYYRILNNENKQLKFKKINQLENGYDVIFSCLPTGVLPKHIDEVLDKTEVLFNVSGDYRLTDHHLLEDYYPNSLTNQRYMDSQYYIPEFHKIDRQKKIINLPGCMAVASIYSLYPLMKNSLIEGKVIIDAKTGSSGGGKKSSEHPAERSQNFRPHQVHGHRHMPEISNAFREMFDENIDLQFSTYSLDLPRGIMTTVYSTLKDGVSEIDVKKAFFKEYNNLYFIDYIKDTKGGRFNPMIKSIVGTNRSEVAAYVDNKNCVSICSLDNMIKGAAGQAVQAFNQYFDFSEEEALSFQNEGMWP